MDAHERDPIADLEALARATDDLRPTDALVDALMQELDPLALELGRAAKETADLAPIDAFTAAVMSKIAPSGEVAWPSSVVRWARVALLGAAAAAVLSLWFSSRAESAYDAAVLGSVAVVEVDE